MSMGITRTLGTNSIPVWQGIGKDIQLVQGGFLLTDPGIPVGSIIPAGTPVIFNETTRTASIIATGIAQATAGGTATDYLILKGHTFKVGDYFSTGVAGGKAYPITVINTTGSTVYDTITVGTSIGAATAGDLLYASTATGATASAYGAANGLLYDDTFSGPGVDISVVIRGTVYARRVPYNASIAALAGLSKIIYSQSK